MSENILKIQKGESEKAWWNFSREKMGFWRVNKEVLMACRKEIPVIKTTIQ